jgi:hypothetical protein
VFDPGLGRVRAGFFFSRYGFNFRATGSDPEIPRKNKQREKIPRRAGRTYSRQRRQVKAKRPESAEIQAVRGVSARSPAVLRRP